VSRFSECFFLIFGQLAVGGVVGLAVPSFRQMERGFYRSSAGVFLAFGLIFILARLHLTIRQDAFSPATTFELGCWAAFIVAFASYTASLWGESYRLRARSFSASLLLGLIALFASAFAYRPATLAGIPVLLYAIPLLTGTLTLGGVATGMLLGWYLIDLGLSIAPLQRLHRLFVRSTLAHLAALLLLPGIVWLIDAPGAAAVERLVTEQQTLLGTRLLLGPLATLAIAALISRTLRIPQTMAATGLYYIAILFVMVGEMLGRLVLFRSGLPL
jgi:hypothetical protein